MTFKDVYDFKHSKKSNIGVTTFSVLMHFATKLMFNLSNNFMFFN